MNYTKLKQEFEQFEEEQEVKQQNVQYQEYLHELGIEVLV